MRDEARDLPTDERSEWLYDHGVLVALWSVRTGRSEGEATSGTWHQTGGNFPLLLESRFQERTHGMVYFY